MRKSFYWVALLATGIAVGPAWGQATTRACGAEEAIGPACLLARQSLPTLPDGPLFWHLDRFRSTGAAHAAAGPTSSVVEAFGSAWLFTIADRRWRARGGKPAAVIGPLSVEPAAAYSAEYLRSVFSPGMTAPLHVHSGPEAFYAIDGDTCLETPAGVQIGRGPGNSLTIEGGPPMLLMAIGTRARHGFALILHDADQPPTTLTHEWHPRGLCQQQYSGRPAPG